MLRQLMISLLISAVSAICNPPCMNGGTCKVVEGVATCDCTRTAYSGTSCETVQCVIECNPRGICQIKKNSKCEFIENSSETEHTRQRRFSDHQATGGIGNNPNLRQLFFTKSIPCNNVLRCGGRDVPAIVSTTTTTAVKCCIICLRNHPPCTSISFEKSTMICRIWPFWGLPDRQSRNTDFYSISTEYRDCSQIAANLPRATSGTYPVTDGRATFLVKCEIANSEGWTVLQKRENHAFNFNRTWKEYKVGFGNINKDYWIGNDVISRLTAEATYSVKVQLYTVGGDLLTATYDSFKIMDESNNYELELGSLIESNTGNIIYSAHYNSFSTYDRDNDRDTNNNCALKNGGGWWFGVCSYSCFLNGLFDASFNCNINSEEQLLRSSVMMIKRAV
ncbi:fibrinogen-like protein A [Anneissia japonica]|uniref:fibrinogen-like protein A n=1 Tax=Anneissia japonica TaxID=1529436 RepID=UPI0014259DBB|nr:fibrinogen-like protein A [Anneissia japonica]